MILEHIISKDSMRVYETLVVMTEASASEIAEHTGIKRTHVYTHLHALIELGLAYRVVINDKPYYRAADPSVFNAYLEKEQKKAEALSVLYHNNAKVKGRSHVQVFEGKQQIERLYYDMLGANSVVSWFGVGDSAPILSQIAYKLADHIRESKMTFKDIIPNDARALSYAQKMRSLKGPTYLYRVLPSGNIDNDILIYDSKVVMIRLHVSDFYATVIDDPSFADTFRSIFNQSWRSLPSKLE